MRSWPCIPAPVGPFSPHFSLPALEFRLWPCCPGWGGSVVPFAEHMSGLRRIVQGARWKVCGNKCPSPCPLRDCYGTSTLPLQSGTGALGACGKPHWAGASWLLKASYPVGVQAWLPRIPYMRGQCQWSRYQSPWYLAPRTNHDPDPTCFSWRVSGPPRNSHHCPSPTLGLSLFLTCLIWFGCWSAYSGPSLVPASL